MPSKNIEKIYQDESFYHIYNRGVNKQIIFFDNDDHAVFLNLLKRYLDNNPTKDNKNREYEWLYERLELLAFCLMPNHFHLLIYQHDMEAMKKLMSGLCTAYSRYFNKKYDRVGPVFQSRYKASLILKDNYLLHISRYIHLNPKNYSEFEYSSLPYYLGRKNASWVRPDRILNMFDGDYEKFVRDYNEHKKHIDEIKSEFAIT